MINFKLCLTNYKPFNSRQMKKIIILLFLTNNLIAQVGIGTTSPDPSSILHLNTTNSGFLAPRLTAVQKYSIINPATGLLIYQTDGAAGFWYYTGSTWVPFGGGSTYTFNNGLTLSGSNAQLGGPLVKTTTLDTKDYDLIFKTTSVSTYPGEVTFEGATKTIMKTKFNANYIEFGNNSPYFNTTFNGSTFTDIIGSPQTIQIVAGFQGSSSPSAGSAIKMGSIEYMYDDQTALKFVDASLLPSIDQAGGLDYSSIGNSDFRWRAVYATDGIFTTSDMRFKTNITPVKYGLNEILKLDTFSYDWKTDEKSIKTKKKIGFSAQQLLELIPEVVQEESILKDEKGQIHIKKDDKLSVNYSELIPVLVNAIKELKAEVDTLKNELKNKQ